MKNFIKDAYHKIYSTYNFVKERSNQPLKEFDDKTPYQMFSHWLIDVLLYGSTITFIWNVWFGWQSYMNIPLMFACGITWWLIMEFISSIKQRINDNQ